MIDARVGESDRPVHVIFIADVSVAEVAAAFAVLHRTGRIGQRLWDGAFDRLMADVAARYQLVATGRDDFFGAALLTRHHPLKAYDAVQLGVGMRLSRTVAGLAGPAVLFISADLTLVSAAAAEGLPVDNPFDHIVPGDVPASDVRGTV